MFSYNITSVVDWFYKTVPVIGTLLISKRQVDLQKVLTDTPLIKIDLNNKTKYKTSYRTEDGSYNNTSCPYVGMKGQPFGRYMKPVEDICNEPDPNIVAHYFLKREKEQYVPGGNLFIAAWIQFMIHDWFEHKVDKNEMTEYGVNKTVFKDKTFTINENSHFWDGSQIYKESLRMKDGSGKIRLGDDDYLPLDINGKEDVGNGPNRWYGIMLLHLLFTKEHNYICDILKEKYPDFDDDKIYGTARLIVVGIIVRIHTVEWTPTILNNSVTALGQNVIYYGLLGKTLNGIVKKGNKYISGYVGSKIDDQGVNFSHISEFSSIYRMHSLLPDNIKIAGDHLKLSETLFDNTVGINKKYSQDNLFKSLGKNPVCSLDLFNYPNFLRKLNINDTDVDLAVVDIYRDRERLLPRYNEFRKNLLLKPIRKWSDITSDKDIIARLKLVYNDDVEKLDLLVGTHLEPKLQGSIFGETIYSVFILHTTRRITNDRFLTTYFNTEWYTEFGMDHIEKTSFKDLLIRHYPELNTVIPDNGFLLFN